MRTDYLIAGSGIAGLRAAIELGGHGNVLMVTKDRTFESSSSYAQGGIAVVTGEDDCTEYHIDDTLRAGGGLCRKRAVRALVEKGPEFVHQLIKWGVRFDKSDGKFLIGLEGAHSRRRILHFRDSTGEEIVRVLRDTALNNPNITKLSKHFVVDLIIRGNICKGAILLNEDTGDIYPVMAKATILTTGGAGRVYSRTSNPPGATGDGIATAYRGGAILSDMEFVQFHPTAFALPGAPSFLITEALRGEGALLRNINKKRFMHDYHPLGELAPRDELSRAIIQEIKTSGGEYVLLDATTVRPAVLKERFPTTHTTCLKYGIDVTRDMIPVSPAAHFVIGGIETDTWGHSSVTGLFAAGEVACTGVHGANRLASNSLLEGLVFGARAGMAAVDYAGGLRISPRIKLNDSDFSIRPGSGRITRSDSDFNIRSVSGRITPIREANILRLQEELRRTMWDNMGIIRSGESLREAMRSVDLLTSATDGHGFTRKELELVNMLLVSRLIISSAIMRRESVGAHFREDFPDRSKKVSHMRLQKD